MQLLLTILLYLGIISTNNTYTVEEIEALQAANQASINNVMATDSLLNLANTQFADSTYKIKPVNGEGGELE